MSNKYAVIEDTVVVNTALADAAFAQEQGWILAYDEVGIGWSYIDGQFIAPVPPTTTPEEVKEQNKQQAEQLLQQTDWTATVDISNPQYSNPYLGNQDEFLAYRSQVRAIAVNPPDTPAVFPTMPKEVWVTV